MVPLRYYPILIKKEKKGIRFPSVLRLDPKVRKLLNHCYWHYILTIKENFNEFDSGLSAMLDNAEPNPIKYNMEFYDKIEGIHRC